MLGGLTESQSRPALVHAGSYLYYQTSQLSMLPVVFVSARKYERGEQNEKNSRSFFEGEIMLSNL